MKPSVLLFAMGMLAFLPSKAQMKIGITAGADYSKMIIRQEFYNDFGVQGTPGYHVGVSSMFGACKPVSFTTDLLYTQSGFSQTQTHISTDWQSNPVKSDLRLSLQTIEMPMVTQFNMKFNRLDVHFGIGPYISYGLKGKIDLDMKGTNLNLKYSEEVRWSKYFLETDQVVIGERLIYDSGYSRIKRLDYGPVVRCGVAFNSFIVDAEYKYGVANRMLEYRQYERMNTYSLGLSFKYLVNLSKSVSSSTTITP